MKRPIIPIAVMLLTLVGALAFAASSYEPGDILIKFKAGTLNGTANTVDATQMDDLGDNWVHVQVSTDQIDSVFNEKSLFTQIRQNPNVEYVQPNYKLSLIEDYKQTDPKILDRLKLLETPSYGWKPKPEIPAATITPEVGADPLLPQQWGLNFIHADEAWQTERGNKKIVVAVIDTGVDYVHEDLAGNIWYNPGEIPGNGKDDDGNGFVDDVIGWDFVDNDNKPYDVHVGMLGTAFGGNPGHGTHCAGTIGALGDNSKGISGIAPNISIMPVRFLNAKGQGTTAQAVKAINYAVHNGAKILSNSWGSEGEDPKDDNQALKDAIKNAMDKNVLFIAAAGNGHKGVGYDNDTDSKPATPASYPIDNIISVAAVDKAGSLAPFSNWGKKTVHVGAPGVGIMSTMAGNRYGDSVIKVGSFAIPWEGTSMAAPFVSGAAALVWAAHPEYKWSDVKLKLLSTVDKLPSLDGKTVSGGKINLAAAIK